MDFHNEKEVYKRNGRYQQISDMVVYRIPPPMCEISKTREISWRNFLDKMASFVLMIGISKAH